MINDTTRVMPMVEEIEAMANRLLTPGLNMDALHATANMLRAIADQMRKSEPVAWQYRLNNEEGIGSWNECRAEHVHIFQLKPTYEVRALYAHPYTDADDARRYRYIKLQMETGAVQTQLPLHRSVYWIGTYIDCDDVQNVDEAIDAAMKEDSHDH